jgi:hypothetical protein
MVPAIPPCTQVIIETIKPVSSAVAKAGDFFEFRSIGAVVINNKIVIPSGTHGYGIVTIAQAAGRGHGGVLGLEPLYFNFPDGDEVHVVPDRRPNALNGHGASMQLPAYAGAVPIPGFSLVVGAYNSMRKGKDVTIPTGSLASVFASDSPETAKCQSDQAPGKQ